MDITLLKNFLLTKFPGIVSLHEFHTWTFTPGTLVLTGHIVYQDQGVYCAINTQVEAFIRSQGFAKVTIQPEFPQSLNPSQEDIRNCNLKCKVRRKNVTKILLGKVETFFFLNCPLTNVLCFAP